jgi:oligoendopeptidase F
MNSFYQETIDFQNINEIKAAYEKLLHEEINSVRQLEDWLIRLSRLQEELEEGLSGHYIDFQCHSDSVEAKKQVEYDQIHIEPLIKTYTAQLDEKFLGSPFVEQLPTREYAQLVNSKRNAKELFRKENVDLEVEEDKLTTDYFEITGSLTVKWNGDEKSLSELSPYMEDKNRETRKKAMTLMFEAFHEKENDLQDIMSKLIRLREKKAANANTANYRDYMFKKYERFDYTPNDCARLADSVKKHVTPLKTELQRQHHEKLNVEDYRPWDRKGTPASEKTLIPFETRDELVSKAGGIFEKLDGRFAELLRIMDKKGMLDLTARKGKAPGGFCTTLPVTGTSFIFMNASKTHDDVVTLLHEMGHCIHNDFTQHFKLADYKETPMESAELASMSMELLTMDHWNYFYEDVEALKQAKRNHLQDIIDFLPLGIIIDQFQHWIYENPNHSENERKQKFRALQEYYDAGYVNWTGFENWQEISWLRILHIFEVPFYFIEYVIAQIGALQVFKQYRKDPEKTLENFTSALKLGSSVPLPDVYAAAGIKFDFSSEIIEELMLFLQEELEGLK